MIDSKVPLVVRALHLAPGMFSDMVRTRDTAACTWEANAARAAAATSANPLLCLARAAWWTAVSERCAACGANEGVLTGTAE